VRARWPVYRSSRGRRGSSDPPPTRDSVRKTAWFVVTLLAVSAGSRFALRRRASLGPAALFAVVDRNRAKFVRITIVDRDERESIVFARWDEATDAYRTVAGVRVTVDGEERMLAPSVPVEYGPSMLRPTDDSGRTLSVPVHATMWLLARVVEARDDAGLRTGAAREPALEPILDRFVVVRDANGPDAPHVYRPGYLEALIYPGAFAAALLIATLRSDDPLSAQAWLFAALMILGLVELLLWSFVLVARRR